MANLVVSTADTAASTWHLSINFLIQEFTIEPEVIVRESLVSTRLVNLLKTWWNSINFTQVLIKECYFLVFCLVESCLFRTVFL